MAKPFKDLTGQRFGRLTVLRRQAVGVWVCACDCGTEKTFLGTNLSSGATKSCGCLNRELVAERSTTHGFRASDGPSEYGIWRLMVGRCYSTADTSYPNYGGRGIVVCDAWFNDYRQFLRDMGPRPSPEATLERIDNDGNYEPANCRWATRTEQQRNRRNNIVVTINGEKTVFSDAVSRSGLRYQLVHDRIFKYGWEPARAFGMPETTLVVVSRPVRGKR